MSVVDYRAEGVLQTGESSSDLAWVAEMMSSRIIKHGVAAEEDLQPEIMRQRIDEELKHAGSAFIRDMNYGICAGNPIR